MSEEDQIRMLDESLSTLNTTFSQVVSDYINSNNYNTSILTSLSGVSSNPVTTSISSGSYTITPGSGDRKSVV